jgi:hypothetical protein
MNRANALPTLFLAQSTAYYVNNYSFTGDVIIYPGAQVIMSGTITFPAYAKITVKHKALLNLDYAVLTNSTNTYNYADLWQGIYVEGSTSDEYPDVSDVRSLNYPFTLDADA